MAFKLGDNDNDMNSYHIKLKTHSIRENLCLILLTNLSKSPLSGEAMEVTGNLLPLPKNHKICSVFLDMCLSLIDTYSSLIDTYTCCHSTKKLFTEDRKKSINCENIENS